MKFHKNHSWTLLSVLALSAVCSNFSFADDDSVTEGLTAAKALFAQRSATSSQAIDDLLAKLAPLEAKDAKADDSDLNYDVLILEARAYYWKGEHVTSNSDKK